MKSFFVMLRCPAYSVMQTVLDNMIEQKILELFLTSEGIDVMEGREDDFKSFKEKILDDEKMKESYNEGVITDILRKFDYPKNLAVQRLFV